MGLQLLLLLSVGVLGRLCLLSVFVINFRLIVVPFRDRHACCLNRLFIRG